MKLLKLTLYLSVILSSLNLNASASGLSDAENEFNHPVNYDLSAEIWGEAGRAAYSSAASLMASLYPEGKRLPYHVIATLYPFYGRTSSNVRIHWDALPLDEWAAASFSIDFSEIGAETVAQTFGYDIYLNFKEPSGCYDEELLAIISHEIIHAKQYERYESSLSNFGYHYFKKYKLANKNYFNNSLEEEAFSGAKEDLKSCPL